MTLDEAIFVLEKMKNTHGIVPAYEVNALSIAIRSLEAWGKVRAEIEQITSTMGVSYNQYVSKIDVLQIIDNHLEELEGKKDERADL